LGNKIKATIAKILAWCYFSRPENLTGWVAVVKWWELRPPIYNVIVGACGILTTTIVLLIAGVASDIYHEPLGLPDPPIFFIFGIIAYGIAANVCYAGGWVTELLVKWIWRERSGAFGEISFFLGILLSVLLTLAPICCLVDCFCCD
jgi:hypothetical protein